MAHTPYTFPRNHKLFMVFHWMGIILLTPLMIVSYEQLFTSSSIFDSAELIGVLFLFSIFFGLPSLLLYLLSYFHFSGKKISWPRLKWVLIAVSTLGAACTNLVISGMYMLDLAFYYGIASVIIGALVSRKY